MNTLPTISELWKPALLCLAIAIGIVAPVYINITDKQPLSIFSKTTNTPAKTFLEIQNLIDKLPDSPVKGNLMIIIATEYAGNSAELNEILQQFAKMQMEKLHNKDTI